MIKVSAIGHLDFLLDFGPWPRINGIIAWKANADYKVGFERADTYRHYIYDHKVMHSDVIHEIENYRNILRAMGISVTGLRPDLRTDVQIRKDRNYVVFHLYPGGAMGQQRSWANERWLELGEYIYHKYGMTILFSGGSVDRESADGMVQFLKSEGIKAENIAGEYNLQEMASVLQYARLVVSVNTGIMHYAAAVGVPLIAIHGATSDIRWGPLSENAVVVKSGEDCQPCISLGFESNCSNPHCMDHVSVEMVIIEVDKIMEE